jgi:hypothetical protein
MKIAIVSDTHGNLANFKKAIGWIEKQNIKIILHCGDVGDLEFLKKSLANFSGRIFGVFGNMDYDNKILIAEYNKILNIKMEEKILETKIGAKKIAITHKPQDGKILAESEKYDIVFYGHTHKPWEQKIGNCRFVNPGELAGQLYKPTFAVYDTKTDLLQLKILDILT